MILKSAEKTPVSPSGKKERLESGLGSLEQIRRIMIASWMQRSRHKQLLGEHVIIAISHPQDRKNTQDLIYCSLEQTYKNQIF